MFFDKHIEIIETPGQPAIKIATADVQPFNKLVSLDCGVSLECTMKAFVKPDPAITEKAYFKVDGILYKVMELKTWTRFYEVLLYRCERQGG